MAKVGCAVFAATRTESKLGGKDQREKILWVGRKTTSFPTLIFSYQLGVPVFLEIYYSYKILL